MSTPAQLWPGPAGIRELPAGTDAWALHAAGFWLVVPTNQVLRANGAAVMGAGLALDAARAFPDVPFRYGRALAAGTPRVVIAEHRLLLAPTKDDWRAPARMALVGELLAGVARWAGANPDQAVVLPSPGCGRGGLPWPAVRAAALEQLAPFRVALLPPVLTPHGR